MIGTIIVTSGASVSYAPVVEDDNAGPSTAEGGSITPAPVPSPSLPPPPLSPTNLTTTNANASIFLMEWGGSCLKAAGTNCLDKDGPTGNLSLGDGQFWGIWGLAANSSNVFVTDVLNSRIQKFDLNGTFIKSWGSFCDLSTQQGCVSTDTAIDSNLTVGAGQFNKPSGIAVDSRYVFVVDHNNRTQKFDYNGNFVKSWGSMGNGTAQFKSPEGIAVDQNSSDVYVADSGNNRIQKFNNDGRHLATWGSFCEIATFKGCVDPDGHIGSSTLGDGQFKYPQGIFVSSESGNVYVADSGNNRIQEFDSNGTFIKRWGSVGNSLGEFRRPADLAIDSGIVYVVDSDNNRIQEFDSNGTFIRQWGSECLRRYDRPFSPSCADPDGPSGNLELGQGQFSSPSGITIEAGKIFVADNSNDLIQVFNASTANNTQGNISASINLE